jgi:NitT/TauT family transport system substrate-binding protein
LRRPDVVVVPLRGNHVDLWQAGQLDAIVTYEPWRTRLERAGLVDLFDSRRTPQLIVDVLAVRSEALFRHRPAVRAVVAAHFRALRRWQDNPVDTSFHLAAGLGIPPDEWPQALRNLDLPDVAYNREYLSGSAPELSRVARELEAILRRAGLMQASAKLDGLFVADFLPGAEA